MKAYNYNVTFAANFTSNLSEAISLFERLELESLTKYYYKYDEYDVQKFGIN